MKTLYKVSHSAYEALDKVADATGEAGEVLCKKGEQLRKTEQRLVKNCRSYISDNPLTSVSIAMLTGYLMSRLLNCDR
ncbi:MAG: hypothetical protein PHG00_10985 [Methylococcales bacterium]|nr:hypothetical protein [Methylococcales bacterium]